MMVPHPVVLMVCTNCLSSELAEVRDHEMNITEEITTAQENVRQSCSFFIFNLIEYMDDICIIIINLLSLLYFY